MPQDASGLSRLSTAAIAQANRLLDLRTPLGDNRLVAETLSATEQLSGGAYRLEITALSDDAHIPLKALMGQPVTLRLQTALDREQPRLWHGHATAVRYLGANGGLARYGLTVEPWLAFLRARRDSFAYQDKTVIDIVDSIFGDYKGQGTLAPQWRWEVKDRAVYAKRSLTIQYRETDYAFIERLLAEEGLFYWVEHADDGHTLVIADHNDAFKAGPQASVRFARADVTETEDSIQHWSPRHRWQTNAVRMASWDYRSAQARPVSAQADTGKLANTLDLVSDDYPGQYAYEDSAQGERLAHNALAALRVRQQSVEGAGTVRTLAPGQRFELTGHYQQGGPSAFVVIAITHQARNNFDADLGRAVSEAQGATATTRSSIAIPSPASAAIPNSVPRPGTAMASACIPVPRYLARRRRWWWAPRGRCTPTATTASRCSSTGSAARPPAAAWRTRRATRTRPPRTSWAPGCAWPSRLRAATGAAISCRASGRKCWWSSCTAISTVRWWWAPCITARAPRMPRTTRCRPVAPTPPAMRRPGSRAAAKATPTTR